MSLREWSPKDQDTGPPKDEETMIGKTPNNIIIRMPNWLGDVVMATPVVAEAKAAWPDASVTVMCQANTAPLLQEDPHVDELYAFHRPSGWLHRQPYRDIIKTLQEGHYDLGLLLTNSFSSAWWFWRGGVQRRVGFQGNVRSWLLTQAVPYPMKKEEQHQVVTYKALLQALGVKVTDRTPRLYVTEEEIVKAQSLLKKQGITPQHILVGVNPGAAFGSAKCWLPNRFREVTQRLLENPLVRVVYFGDVNGAPLVNDICMGMPERVVNLAGKTSIRELMTMIKLCHAFLTNDSGPMHIASALGTPLVALFGSTSDVKTGPFGNSTVIHHHVECSPCYRRECPRDFECMKGIDVDSVYQAMNAIIQDKRPVR